MRSAYWKGLIFVIMIAVLVICDTPRAPAEGRYLTLAGPAGFFFMLDRMTGGFRVCPVLGGAVGPGGCCQGLGGGAFIASVGVADEPFLDADTHWRGRDVHCHGRGLLRVYDGWRVHCACP